MKFRRNDKVRTKTWEEIVKLGTPSEEVEGRIEFKDTQGIIFNENMVEYCGKEFRIEGVNKCFDIPAYNLVGINWTWVEDWLEAIE